jgi:outer membrane lipoprotein SlyB
MKTLMIAAAMGMVFAAGQAEAKGCLKGAAVGGLAGHMAHHGVLGAIGGCAVGHHMASKQQQQTEQGQPQHD